MYLKKILLLLAVCYTHLAFAEVVIFNKSSQYDMDVTYNFCTMDDNFQTSCLPSETVIIPHGERNQDGLVAITPPPTDALFQYMNIKSATERTKSGQIFAQGNYALSETESYCEAATITYTWDDFNNKKANQYTLSRVITLDDHSLSRISCREETSNVARIN